MSTKSHAFADVIVLAGGSSTRMGGPDKLLMEFGGQPLLAWTLDAVRRARCVSSLVVVARQDRVAAFARSPWVRRTGARVVAGGERRQDSVAAGVAAATGEVVLIHDGARPLVTPELVDRVADAARDHGAAVPVVAVPESMRLLRDGHIVGIMDKTGLYRSQTPHGARRDVLLSAYQHQDPHGPETFIDETTLVQSAGVSVTTVPGDPVNLKVTLRGDEELAFALLEARSRPVRGAPADLPGGRPAFGGALEMIT